MTTTAQEFFDELPGRVDPARLVGISSTYLFDVTGTGAWTVAIADGGITVTEGEHEADATVIASEKTFLKLISGESNPTTAYLTGKIKVRGDMSAVLKLQNLF